MKERKLADSTEDHKKILILTSLGRTISLKFYSSRSASACSLASGVWMSSFIRLRSWFVASTLRCLCSVCKWLAMRIRELCLHRSKLLWTSPEKRCLLHIHKLLYFPVSASLASTKFFESKVRQIWSILTPIDFGTRSLTHESSEMCYYIGMRPPSHFAAAVNYSLNERFTGP